MGLRQNKWYPLSHLSHRRSFDLKSPDPHSSQLTPSYSESDPDPSSTFRSTGFGAWVLRLSTILAVGLDAIAESFKEISQICCCNFSVPSTRTGPAHPFSDNHCISFHQVPHFSTIFLKKIKTKEANIEIGLWVERVLTPRKCRGKGPLRRPLPRPLPTRLGWFRDPRRPRRRCRCRHRLWNSPKCEGSDRCWIRRRSVIPALKQAWDRERWGEWLKRNVEKKRKEWGWRREAGVGFFFLFFFIFMF